MQSERLRLGGALVEIPDKLFDRRLVDAASAFGARCHDALPVVDMPEPNPVSHFMKQHRQEIDLYGT
jgi:hypothetical protein